MVEKNNWDDNVNLTGTPEDDKLNNWGGSNVTIDGAAGNDTIYISGGTDNKIYGGVGNDSVTNWGKNALIDGGGDSDSIENYADDVTLEGGEGNDYIHNSGVNGKIFSGTGNDAITNWSSNVTIEGGDGNDSINTYVDDVTVAGGTGNDYIYNGNGADNITFKYSAGDGNDVIEGFNSKSILQIASGKIDSALSNGTDAVLQIGNGIITLKGLYSRDTIKVRKGNGAVEEFIIPTAVTKTEGKDDISNSKSNVTVLGLGGNDDIYNDGSNVTIDGGAGNDYINNNGGDFVIVSGNTGDDLLINGGYWSNMHGGKNVTLDGSAGNDSINNDKGSGVIISGGTGKDFIVNKGNGYAHVYLGNGLINEVTSPDKGNNVIIDGGDDNDYIANGTTEIIDSFRYLRDYGDKITLNGGAGNDSIVNNGGDNVLLNGGNGNDVVINNGGLKVTLNSGAGDDTLTGNALADTFVYESGNDVITNYRGEDTVYIASGKVDAYSFSGADLIFKIGNGSLTLKSMKNHAITVKDSSGKTSTQIYGTGYSGHDVMKKFVQSMANSKLNSAAKVDAAIKACSQFNSVQDVVDHLISDRKKAGDAETFLQDYCGIFLDDTDTGAVTGWDAGGLTVKTINDLLPKKGSAYYPSSTSFTKRGLTLTVPEKSTLNSQEQLVIQGLYSWWMEDTLKLIEETYGLKFTDKPLTINFSFRYEPNESYWGLGGPELVLNMSHTSFNESDKSGNGLDGLFSHELTHVMQYNFNSFDTGIILEAHAGITGGWDIGGKFELEKIVSTSAKLTEAFNSIT